MLLKYLSLPNFQRLGVYFHDLHDITRQAFSRNMNFPFSTVPKNLNATLFNGCNSDFFSTSRATELFFVYSFCVQLLNIYLSFSVLEHFIFVHLITFAEQCYKEPVNYKQEAARPDNWETGKRTKFEQSYKEQNLTISGSIFKNIKNISIIFNSLLNKHVIFFIIAFNIMTAFIVAILNLTIWNRRNCKMWSGFYHCRRWDIVIR